ncbi:hypothetical protein LTV02_26950 [Nocardia yamanashiensis]|uniref:hypothetical protein n=1 Tax=Nocardia yamanashiensis TaxID=209247 RepID=UPI001E2FCB8E|nr:hypothetical protein [Nocardia yamanashiensis]UGT39680.1 hypothetical protein LTV02_26950 [Nocardia yamanashiensis]
MRYETPSSRAELIQRGGDLLDAARRFQAAGDSANEKLARDERALLLRRYAEMLPDIAVARCPDSGVVVHHKIDTGDLDGWFWDHGNPLRTPGEVPATWLTMCGAMRLGEPIAFAKFWCEPGPGTPYVIPRILSSEAVRAVISQVQVGPHIGWAISYFGPRPRGVQLENSWGANVYDVYDDAGEWLGWAEHESPVSEYDFDLGPWLDSRKLLWIEPGDSETQLRTGTADCPYLNMPGERTKAFIFRGEVRRA